MDKQEVTFYYNSRKPIVYIAQTIEMTNIPMVGDIVNLIPDQVSKKLKKRDTVIHWGAEFTVTKRKLHLLYPNHVNRSGFGRQDRFVKQESWRIYVEPVTPFEDI